MAQTSRLPKRVTTDSSVATEICIVRSNSAHGLGVPVRTAVCMDRENGILAEEVVFKPCSAPLFLHVPPDEGLPNLTSIYCSNDAVRARVYELRQQDATQVVTQAVRRARLVAYRRLVEDQLSSSFESHGSVFPSEPPVQKPRGNATPSSSPCSAFRGARPDASFNSAEGQFTQWRSMGSNFGSCPSLPSACIAEEDSPPPDRDAHGSRQQGAREGSRLWHQGEDPGFGSGELSGFASPHGELVPSVCRAASSVDLLRREHSTSSSAAVRQPRGHLPADLVDDGHGCWDFTDGELWERAKEFSRDSQRVLSQDPVGRGGRPSTTERRAHGGHPIAHFQQPSRPLPGDHDGLESILDLDFPGAPTSVDIDQLVSARSESSGKVSSPFAPELNFGLEEFDERLSLREYTPDHICDLDASVVPDDPTPRESLNEEYVSNLVSVATAAVTKSLPKTDVLQNTYSAASTWRERSVDFDRVHHKKTDVSAAMQLQSRDEKSERERGGNQGEGEGGGVGVGGGSRG
uniref:Uncharacterized protein n=1 Tax=Noctiluca scintillans TaxID=2966 RepID=A0A7S1AMR2_NOCSC|mmetsp:Transcript_52735/g.140703  ORF Transcript_52735/g.140703 Transcript_52735/m.140703 type:complete len:519 (+) Transcript_52735:61-1617(+)